MNSPAPRHVVVDHIIAEATASAPEVWFHGQELCGWYHLARNVCDDNSALGFLDQAQMNSRMEKIQQERCSRVTHRACGGVSAISYDRSE